MMISCPSCSQETSDKELFCQHCNTELLGSSTPTRRQPSSGAGKSSGGNRPSGSSASDLLRSAPSRSKGRFVAGTMLAERYRIISLLGQGGMGEVYKAEDLKLDQVVALKFLPESFGADEAMLARFHGEVRTARQVSHANVCRVYDIGEIHGLHYLSMEFIDGEDLSALLRRIGRLPGDKAAEIARQICAGLAAAHDNGVLHRDLKPANVMIDGRGRARITDFGLAVVAEELRGNEVFAGTPTYMAPEQLAGKEVTQRSDVYALGLVLYELFTGKRTFDAKTLPELIELHEKSVPTNPSELVKDIDPLAERAILRCLEKDPLKRPANALQVSTALPGGDPLQVALAAGELPSPQMVAAAGKKTGLKPAIALACVAAIVIGTVLVAWSNSRTRIIEKTPFSNSPEVLEEKAREILTQLGYTEKFLDSTRGMAWTGYPQWLSENGNLPQRWNQLEKGYPAPLYFWYRQSPRSLRAYDLQIVSEGDPPLNISGMTLVRLDALGRLMTFRAVPPQIDGEAPATETDWNLLFKLAGLDASRFTSTEAKWTPLTIADTRKAWTGTWPDLPDVPLRIEAAAYRGRLVFFDLLGPWNKPSRMEVREISLNEKIGYFSQLGIYVLIIGFALILAWRNFRQGKGDKRGAFRLAMFIFLTSLSFRLLKNHHAADYMEWNAIEINWSAALYEATLLWLVYMALEPFVRKRWPTTLISWNRLLNGEWNDPLVGRDLLIGITIGAGMALFFALTTLLSMKLGSNPSYIPWLDSLLGARHLSADLLNRMTWAVRNTLISVFLIFLIRVVCRRNWLTAVIFLTLVTLLDAFSNSALSGKMLLLAAAASLLANGLILLALFRFGVLAMAAGLFFSGVLYNFTLTTNLNTWYSHLTLMLIALLAAFTAYAFKTSLAGERLFKGNLLED